MIFFQYWVTDLLAALLVIVLFFSFRRRRSQGLPPGPVGIPFFGYWPFLTTSPHVKLQELSKTYGDVISLNIFGTHVIVLNSHDAIREAYVIQGKEFTGRPKLFTNVKSPISSIGLISSEGEIWKEHRRFAIHTLRDFGFGKQSLEARIQNITEDLIQVLRESNGQPINVQTILGTIAANVICSLLFDKKFEISDQRFQKVLSSINSLVSNVPAKRGFFNSTLERYLPIQYLPGFKYVSDLFKVFEDVLGQHIKDHQDSFDPTLLRDFVDVYLDRMSKTANAADSSFTIDWLKAVVLNLFNAGTETTANTIYWLLGILMFRPEIQLNIQSEIDDVIGRERLPSIMDRHNMPYMEATINEVLRFSSLVPISVFRCNPEEVAFRNYIIPKRSIIIPNLYAAHFDPKYWPEPEHFDPSRFLSSDGKLEKRESFFPFSAGTRICMGETLARMELFLFSTSIFQRFTIEPADGDRYKILKSKSSAVTRTLLPYKLCARLRGNKF